MNSGLHVRRAKSPKRKKKPNRKSTEIGQWLIVSSIKGYYDSEFRLCFSNDKLKQGSVFYEKQDNSLIRIEPKSFRGDTLVIHNHHYEIWVDLGKKARKTADVAHVSLYRTQFDPYRFAHYKSTVKKMEKGGIYSFESSDQRFVPAKIFYRTGNSDVECQKRKWNLAQTCQLGQPFEATGTHYQFLMSYDLRDGEPAVHGTLPSLAQVEALTPDR
jgi:hypothetical protein